MQGTEINTEVPKAVNILWQIGTKSMNLPSWHELMALSNEIKITVKALFCLFVHFLNRRLRFSSKYSD